MPWRLIFYCALGSIPTALGLRNIRIGGDFGPGFAAGLVPVILIVGVVEAVRFAVRWGRRRRAAFPGQP